MLVSCNTNALARRADSTAKSVSLIVPCACESELLNSSRNEPAWFNLDSVAPRFPRMVAICSDAPLKIALEFAAFVAELRSTAFKLEREGVPLVV